MDSLQIVIQIRQVIQDLQSHYSWFSLLLNPYIFFIASFIIVGTLITAIEGLLGTFWVRIYLISRIKLFFRSFIIKEDCPIFSMQEQLENIILELGYEDIVVKELASGEFMIRKISFTTQRRTATPLMCGIMKLDFEQRKAVFAGILTLSSVLFLLPSIVLYFVPILFFPLHGGTPFLYYFIPLAIGFMGYMIYRLQAREFDKIIEKLTAVTMDRK
ncbi:MAG: hypothetical protein ABSD46_09370 [Bacteroidota bacterium]